MHTDLFHIGKKILAQADLDSLLRLAMDTLIDQVKAERGLILLFDQRGRVRFQTARNLSQQDLGNPVFEISRTLIDRVRQSGQAICVKNALNDAHLSKNQSIVRLNILSVICLPMCKEGEVFGAVYLDHRRVRGIFSEAQAAQISPLVDFIAIAAYQRLSLHQLTERVDRLEQTLRDQYDFSAIIGQSAQMLKVMDIVSRVAQTNATVLIEGETGTGKELVARAIHLNSQRKDNPMVCINCGALPEHLLESELFGYEKGAFTGAVKSYRGKFAQAHSGTLFLDEVDEMSFSLQVKLLRVLQWGEVTPLGSESPRACDVRIVAATKRPLQALIQEGRFRDDLYYRLNLVAIMLPPLRERKSDLPLLVEHFLKQACHRFGKSPMTLSAEAQSLLCNHDFPGNVRELENMLQRAVLLSSAAVLQPSAFPELKPAQHTLGVIPEQMTFKEAKRSVINHFEREFLLAKLQSAGGVIREAARLAGMHEKNFHQKLSLHNIHVEKQGVAGSAQG